MTFPTHILAGLVIGKLTGDYTAALTGSLFMDLDHLISYHQNGILFKPRAILHESLTEKDPWGSQKNIFHSVQAWAIISLLVVALNLHFGLIFSLAYFVHLSLDALNGDVYPFYPYKKFQIKKPIIRYLSKKEAILGVSLLLLFLIA
ncbi:MAG: metal-dependent hydrolase [bacterium]|nr:metal-dependent hydrolase [bacterium]